MACTETPAATRTRSVSASMTRRKEATGLRPARAAQGQVKFAHPWIAAITRVERGAARRSRVSQAALRITAARSA
jgi:hypothetical protein